MGFGEAIEAEGNQLSSKLLEHAERLEWAEQLGISECRWMTSDGLRYWGRGGFKRLGKNLSI